MTWPLFQYASWTLLVEAYLSSFPQGFRISSIFSSSLPHTIGNSFFQLAHEFSEAGVGYNTVFFLRK